MAILARSLEQAELGDVAADGRLRDIEPLLHEGIDQLALAAHGTRCHQLPDGPLAQALQLLARGHAAPTGAARPAVIRVPKVGSSSARSSARSAEESAMIASDPSQPSADSAARTFGTIPRAMTPPSIRCSASATVSVSTLW